MWTPIDRIYDLVDELFKLILKFVEIRVITYLEAFKDLFEKINLPFTFLLVALLIVGFYLVWFVSKSFDTLKNVIYFSFTKEIFVLLNFTYSFCYKIIHPSIFEIFS